MIMHCLHLCCPATFRGCLTSETSPVGLLNQPTVCFIHFSSSRLAKSSRAWAPRDSWRASAPCMVTAALMSRFSSSKVCSRPPKAVRLGHGARAQLASCPWSNSSAVPVEHNSHARWYTMAPSTYPRTACTRDGVSGMSVCSQSLTIDIATGLHMSYCSSTQALS